MSLHAISRVAALLVLRLGASTAADCICCFACFLDVFGGIPKRRFRDSCGGEGALYAVWMLRSVGLNGFNYSTLPPLEDQ